MINEIKARRQIRKEYGFTCRMENYMVNGETPASDDAMVRYLLDSIAWLDSFDEEER
jgi:hypothetical protein